MSRWSCYIPILAYHRVGEPKGDHVPTVSPTTFERHLRWLVQFRYQVLSMDELADSLERDKSPPKRSIVITFDDGYGETYEIAWPLLRKFGFPAIVFVTLNEIGLPGFGTWEQVSEMSQDGLMIGSHTMNHIFLPLVGEDRLREEVVESKRCLEARIGKAIHYISYPVGGFTPLVQVLARQAGYRGACTTNRTWPGRKIYLFAMRRIKMTERDANPVSFLAKVSGYYDIFRRLEQPA